MLLLNQKKKKLKKKKKKKLQNNVVFYFKILFFVLIYMHVGVLYMEENKVLLKLVLKLLGNKYSENEIKSVLKKIEILCDGARIESEDLVKAIDVLFEMKKKKMLEKVNEESIELIDAIYHMSYLVFNKNVIDFDVVMRDILMPRKLLKCEKEEEVYEFQESFNGLLFSLVTMAMQSHMFLHSFIYLSEYNNDLYNIVLSEAKCVSNSIIEGKKELVPVVNEINRLYGILYFNLERYDNDIKMVEELGNKLIDNPDVYQQYCESENMSYKPMYYEELKGVYNGSIKLLDASYAKRIEDKREKK